MSKFEIDVDGVRATRAEIEGINGRVGGIAVEPIRATEVARGSLVG